MRNLISHSLIFAALLIGITAVASAQATATASSSVMTGAPMPAGAKRVSANAVPVEFDQVFNEFLKQGEGKIAGGEREILVWNGDHPTAGNISKLAGQIKANFRASGWQYETTARDGDVEVFMLYKDGSPRRVIFGVLGPENGAQVCALMEVVLPGAAAASDSTPKASTSASSGSTPIVFDIANDAHFVNVMGNSLPTMPKFPPLAPKPGRVRGYAKDISGNPLKGATIGIRASYFAGHYSGAQGVTDARGYYEFTIPKGSAHFYNAGYGLDWGGGIAAIGLHPADGKLESFTSADGAVENFVLLPYGITSREKVSENPFIASTYYGGSIRIDYYTVSKEDRGRIAGSIVEGTVIEVTLTPEEMPGGVAGNTFVIRQPIGFKGNFSIHNIPLGRYRITAKAGGKPLRMEEHGKFNPLFGMTPGDAIGSASILFPPDSSTASMVSPNADAWKPVSISLSAP